MLRRFVLCVLLVVGLAACRERTLFNDISQRDANEMVVMLQKAGVTAQVETGKQAGTVTLSVPADQIAIAVQVLEQAGLPRQRQAGLTEVLPKDTWMSSRMQEDARLAYGIGQELASTIQQMAGVLDARVHVALAQKNAIGQIITQPSASVLVRYDETLIGAGLRDDIRGLVANAVAGLSFDRVTVTTVPAAIEARFSAPAVSSAAAKSAFGIEQVLRVIMALALAAALGWFFLVRGKRQQRS